MLAHLAPKDVPITTCNICTEISPHQTRVLALVTLLGACSHVLIDAYDCLHFDRFTAVYGPHHARMLAHLAPKDVPITTHEYHMYNEVPTRPEC